MDFKKCGITLFLCSLITTTFANTIPNSCTGASALLSIVNRPTFADSPCVVPNQKSELEVGYQYEQLTHSAGVEQNFPEAQFRLGLPANNEFTVLLPNYIHQTSAPRTGSTATAFGAKHEFWYNEKWIVSGETLITMPNGSAAFGSKGVGVTLNGLIDYSINSQFILSLMLGGTSETQPSLAGGERFSSINPDLVFTYAPTEKLNLYAEVYGQSKTGPGESNGANADAGILYLLFPSLVVDLEAGHRLKGNLGGFNHYFGTGFSVLFN